MGSLRKTFSFIGLVIMVACVKKPMINRNLFREETSLRFPPIAEETIEIISGNIHAPDGPTDLLVLTNQQLRFLLNKGNGYFDDQTSAWLGSVRGEYHDLKLVDINLDQRDDIVLIGSKISVLINNGQGRFIDETASRLDPWEKGYSEGVFGDLNGDKFPDMVLWGPNLPITLYLNHKGVFKNETSTRLPQGIKNARRIVLGDLDQNKSVDIFVVKSNAENLLLRNNGGGIFIDESKTRLPRLIANHQDAAIGDIDGDGDMDVALAVEKLDSSLTIKSTPGIEEQYTVFNNSDFERGNFSGWSVNGGWQIIPLGGDPFRQKPNPQEGLYYALSVNNLAAANRESSSGTIRSAPFLIPSTAKFLSFLKTGWDGQFGGFNSSFYLKSSIGRILRKASPPLSDTWVLHSWEVSDLKGELVYFEAEDKNLSGAYGSIGFDQLKFSDVSVVPGSEQFPQNINYILHNDGEGYFTDEVLEELPQQPATRVYIKDIDQNQELDIVFLGTYETSVVVNQGKGRFRDLTAGFFNQRNFLFSNLDFGDFNQDGGVDLAGVSQGHPLVFLNLPNPDFLISQLKELREQLKDQEQIDQVVEEIKNKNYSRASNILETNFRNSPENIKHLIGEIINSLKKLGDNP